MLLRTTNTAPRDGRVGGRRCSVGMVFLTRVSSFGMGAFFFSRAQVRAERLRLLEEERDFLRQEKDTLVDRLGSLEARQEALREREKQAGDRGENGRLLRCGSIAIGEGVMG